MTDEELQAENFIKAFRERLHHVDDFVQVVLNGHLEIEGHLDDYMQRIFAHPKYLQEARLSFSQKVCIARAYTPETHDRVDWQVMVLFNQIRNKIAHRKRDAVLLLDVSKIRKLVEGVSKKASADMKLAEGKDVMVYAAALCSGYLAIMEEQLAVYRGEQVVEEE
jgi:hypothetical protein